MIYVVTNRKLIKNGDLYSTVCKVLEYGVKNIILREKDLEYNDLYEVAGEMKLITDEYDANLIVNGSLRAAEEVNAYAYHTSFRGFIDNGGSKKIKNGVSVHSLEEAVEAEKMGADYLLCGNVYETNCKPGLKGKGLEFVSSIASRISIPEIAIGGIVEENIEDVIKAGASGAAVMSSAMENPIVVKKLINNK